LLVDYERDAIRPPEDGDEDVVLARNRLLLVAEDRELDAEGFGESLVLLPAVHADPDHMRARLLEFGDISLIRLELARSATCEGLDVEGQHHALLATKVGEMDR